MKLEGSLDAFGLPDVLHLLHATAKTGALHLVRHPSRAVIHLIEGSVVSGQMTEAGHLALLRRLVGQGLVDEDMVASAAMAAAETGDGLVTTLVVSNVIDADVAQAQMHHLIVDTLFEVLRWDDGDFSFAAEELPSDDVGVRTPPGSLVEEASLRLPAWEAAAEQVPSPAHVPVISRSQSQDVVLSPEDWGLLALVDGRRSVDGIVAEAGWGPFAVVVRLADLSQRGCLEFHVDHKAAEASQAARRDVLTLLDAAEGLESKTPDDARPLARAHGSNVDASLPGADVSSGATSSAPTKAAESAPSSDATAGGATIVSVPTAPVGAVAAPAPASDPEESSAATSAAGDPEAHLLGGAHRPGDVVPPRPEPFLPSRQPEHPEASGLSGGDPGQTPLRVEVVGANAVVTQPALSDDAADVAPGVLLNRSMVLRLIAGVRGL